MNLNYTRSWFQTPNTYDNLNVQNVISGGRAPNRFAGVGNTDQNSKIETFDITQPIHAFSARKRCSIRGLRSPGCVQLLPQRQSLGRSRSSQPANLVHLTVPDAHQCWPAHRFFL